MTTLSRSKTISFLAFGVLIFTANSCSQKRSAVPEQTAKINAEQIARTYGLDSFDQIDAIRYTFTAPAANLSRSWEWEPKTDRVSYEGKDKDGKPIKVSYMRSELSSQPDAVKNVVDPAFINDNYWLLFPLHAYWDTNATVTDQGMQQLPLGNGSAELVAVKYPSEGGYTPGDTWELYVGKDNRVEQMVYRRGGSTKPSVVTATWEGYKKAGPLLISTDHHGTANGNPLRILISDVSVKLTGSENWISAQ
ncbi:MAG TPA: hypothetical protein DCK93_06370 [Blastocatellia bacterium]|jgi:hypothetical protein|nr:hypothetical protein [Blastocatellia bacterium]HAF22527.1 hypothetical protein [Blastocatellia bacterium]